MLVLAAISPAGYGAMFEMLGNLVTAQSLSALIKLAATGQKLRVLPRAEGQLLWVCPVGVL